MTESTPGVFRMDPHRFSAHTFLYPDPGREGKPVEEVNALLPATLPTTEGLELVFKEKLSGSEV